MMHPLSLFFRICFLAIVTVNVAWGSTEAWPERPNVLLILSDDHSFPYLGAYGHPDLKTPNLDRLATGGVLLTQAYTVASQCVPSRASILSGRNVVDIRMSRFSAPLNRDIPTVADLLRQAGYYTGICGRHYHLDGSARMPDETARTLMQNQMITFPERVDYLRVGSDDQVREQFRTFLDQVPEEKPFFMWMNYSDPHRPFTADAYAPEAKKISVPPDMPDTDLLREDLAAHLGEVMHLDELIGQVMEDLKNKGLDENTLVIFMGDNGAALLRGKGTLYQMGLHVPMIVRWPAAVPAGGTTDALVCGQDVAPTILEACRVPVHPAMTGKSYLPVLTGDVQEINDYVFATRVPHSSGLPLHTAYFDLSRAVFNKEYKLIYNALWQLPYNPVDFGNRDFWKDLTDKHEKGKLKEKFDVLFSEPRPMFELYDLENDPNEFNNLSGKEEYADLEQDLKARLHEWMILNQDYLPLPIPPPAR